MSDELPGIAVGLLFLGLVMVHAVIPTLRQARKAREAREAQGAGVAPSATISQAGAPVLHAPRKTQQQQPQASQAPAPLSAYQLFEQLQRSLHLLIVGASDDGKTTTAQAVLAGRIAAGEQIVILDPHATPATWSELPAQGAGADYATLGEAMRGLLAEMAGRYAARAQGCEDFAALTIFVDEWPAISRECGAQASEFMMKVSQEGRKVGMRLVILSQSDRVASLGIKGAGDVRDNFSVLWLGSKAETAGDVSGIAWPAAYAAQYSSGRRQLASRQGFKELARARYPDPERHLFRSELFPPAHGTNPLQEPGTGGNTHREHPPGTPRNTHPEHPEIDDASAIEAAKVLLAQGWSGNAVAGVLKLRRTKIYELKRELDAAACSDAGGSDDGAV